MKPSLVFRATLSASWSCAVLLALGVLVLGASSAGAQQISIDRGVRAGELWCFPLATDSLTYVYLPSSVRLSDDEQGRPQFSFVRYVINTGGDTTSAASITEARGGGVLTLLVELDTPEAMVKEAAEALKQTLKIDKVTLRGPLVYSDGRFTLVSSVLGAASNRAETKAIATGRAPVLEGNRIALSFDLDPVHANLLLKSFAMATPDVSLMFDMAFTGLTDAYHADLSINWSEVSKSQSFSTGATVYYVSTDIALAFDELRRSHSIELRTAGTDAPSEALLNTVYAKLLDLLFKPVQPEREPPQKNGDAMAALTKMFTSKGSSRKMMGFGAEVAYKLRETRTEGKSLLTFNHRATVERHNLIAFNLGEFESAHGSDPRYFRTVNLGDPAFSQREVQVGIDGALLPELDSAINSVTVTLRKTHTNGEQDLRELVLDKKNAIAGVANSRLVYGWNNDQDRVTWLGYDYRTRWSFRGGGVHETEWAHSESPMIDLFAPYERRTIQLAGDPSVLKARGVRAVVVEIEYPFFSERRRPQLVLRPEESLDQKRVEITLPLGQPAYDVTLTWQMAGGERLTAKRHETSGLVFVDELPAH